jgi:uncharacterized protein YggT (Ycf19 family)
MADIPMLPSLCPCGLSTISQQPHYSDSLQTHLQSPNFKLSTPNSLTNCLSRLDSSQASLALLGSGFWRQAFLCFWAHILTCWWASHANLWLLASAGTFLQLLAHGLSSPTAASWLIHSLQLNSWRWLDWLLYKASAWTAQKMPLLLTCVMWDHVFHCSIAASCWTSKKTLLFTVASLLHDVTTPTQMLFTRLLWSNGLLFSSVIVCLLCCNLAMDNSFCLSCYNIIHIDV